MNAARPLPGLNCESMTRNARFIRCLLLLSCVTFLSGCFPTFYLPKLGYERLEIKLSPPDPVLSGPGGVGPIWATPEVTGPNGCTPCGTCCPPGNPLQPIDPFGWLKHGSMGTQEIDPIGWVFGI